MKIIYAVSVVTASAFFADAKAFAINSDASTADTSVVVLLAVLAIIVLGELILIIRNARNRMEIKDEVAVLIAYISNTKARVIEVKFDSDESIEYKLKNNKIIYEDMRVSFENYIYSVVHPHDMSIITPYIGKRMLEKIMNEKAVSAFECRLKTDSDTYRMYSFVMMAMPKSHAHSKSVMIFQRDIEEVRQSEQEKNKILQDALYCAERSNAAKSLFTSRVSHEIRTPLNAIFGYIDIAKNSCGNEERVADCLEKASGASQHLLDIVNELLDISSIETGKMKLSKDVFSISELVDSVESVFSNEAQQKNIEFCVKNEELSNQTVIGDRFRTNQILMNLLSNAVKFTKSGGKVEFNIKNGGIRNKMMMLRFEVKDNGIGMNEEFVKRLFTPFEREDVTMTQILGGNGIGLAITRNLVSMMDGNISCESKKNTGTVFTVEIPFAVDMGISDKHKEKIRTEANKDKTKALLSGKRVLLVEDNAMNAEVAMVMLEQMGIVVDIAENGKIAADIYERSAVGVYKVILMDIQMPVMDGLEAAKVIRNCSHPEAETVPIIAMTANAFEEDIKAAIDAGMDNHISKPINKDILYTTLSVYMK